MEPSKANATSGSKIPDLNQRISQRQTVPTAGEADDVPPPYEPSGSTTSASGPAATVVTPPSMFPSVDSARSSTSSVRSEDAVFLGGQTQQQQQQRGEGDGEGYRRTSPMSIDNKDDDDKWAHTKDHPGCFCSESGGCFFSSRGGCCWSDRGGCFCSDTGGCCFSSNNACCWSGKSPNRPRGPR